MSWLSRHDPFREKGSELIRWLHIQIAARRQHDDDLVISALTMLGEAGPDQIAGHLHVRRERVFLALSRMLRAGRVESRKPFTYNLTSESHEGDEP